MADTSRAETLYRRLAVPGAVSLADADRRFLLNLWRTWATTVDDMARTEAALDAAGAVVALDPHGKPCLLADADRLPAGARVEDLEDEDSAAPETRH